MRRIQEVEIGEALKRMKGGKSRGPNGIPIEVWRCLGDRAIVWRCHTMKLWERVIEHPLRRVTSVTQNQFGFMPGRSTIEAIFLIRQLMERYREQKDLHMVFIDLEKAYDKVPRNVMWWALEKHKVPTKYITLIRFLLNIFS